jgi:ubiquitin-protein ligase
MKRVLGIRAAVKEAKVLHDQWHIADDDAPRVSSIRFRVKKEIRQVKEQFDKQLLAQKQAGIPSAFRNIPGDMTLFFTECVPIGGNDLHLQFKIQVHKSEIPDSYWPNCQFTFEALFEEGKYPAEPPHVTCKTPIYHPNIADTSAKAPGEVCITLLKSQWRPSATLFDIIESIFLTQFQDPNGNDPLPEGQEAADLLLANKEEFRKRARSHAEKHKTFIPGSEEHRRW